MYLSVRPSVRARATGHTFWPRNLIFGLSDPWDMRKENTFFVFQNVHIYTFYMHFSVNYLYNTSDTCFQATGHRFSPKNLIFGLRESCTIEN